MELLDDDTLVRISSYLSIPEWVSFKFICKQFNTLLKDTYVIKSKIKHLSELTNSKSRTKVTLRNKSIRSQFDHYNNQLTSIWKNHIHSLQNIFQQIFITQYNAEVSKDIKRETVKILQSCQNVEIYSQQMKECYHDQILLLSKHIYALDNKISNYHQLALHCSCQTCYKQCLNEAWICCSCTWMDSKNNTINYRNIFCSLYCGQRNKSHLGHPFRKLIVCDPYPLPHKYIASCLHCGATAAVAISSHKISKHILISKTKNSETNIRVIDIHYICRNFDNQLRNKLQHENGRNQILNQLSSRDLLFRN
jgi:hypothetical protein